MTEERLKEIKVVLATTDRIGGSSVHKHIAGEMLEEIERLILELAEVTKEFEREFDERSKLLEANARLTRELIEAKQELSSTDQAFRQLNDELDSEAENTRLTNELAEHRQAVGQFLTDMYSTMIDPLAEGQSNVAETCAALLTEAKAWRQREYDIMAENAKLREAVLNNASREEKK